jgi:pimeloyl-ACP methyl ester carboxylesterase
MVGLLTASAAGFVALNVLSFNHARAMLRYSAGGPRTSKPEALAGWHKIKVLLAGVNVPRPQSDRQPSELSPQCRRLAIKCASGVTLGAWYVDSGPQSPLLILFHGYAAEKACLVQEGRAFLELGASVLLVDFRGSGESSENYTTVGFHEADDVSAVMRYIRDTLPHRQAILYGQSMGAAAILRSIHQGDVKPDAVIVEAVFDSMLNTVRNRFDSMGVPSFPSAELLVFWGGVQNRFNGFAHKPVVYAKSLTCPALFMQGAGDPRARIEDAQRVFASVLGPKQFKVFHAGHESYAARFPSEWRTAVESFMKTTAKHD